MGNDDEADGRETLAFPEIDERIRAAVREYDAVFPKLNFSSPKDASWLLPSSSPLKCTSPSDVYMLLKSSDFIAHDLSDDSVFEGCTAEDQAVEGNGYTLELVLRKWYAVDRSREMRCFVRDNILLGISQRDDNYYDFLNDHNMQANITSAIEAHWTTEVKPRWTGPHSYIFDTLLTRDFSRFHVIDFAPYAPRTDALLFTYDELRDASAQRQRALLRVIDSPAHPAATRNAPAHQHNMLPLEALSLSAGRGVMDFQQVWVDEVQRGMQSDSDSDADSQESVEI